MRSAKVAAKPLAKPVAKPAVKVAARKAAATKSVIAAAPRAVARVEVKAPAKQAASRKSSAPVTAKIAPKVAPRIATKAASLIMRDSFTMTTADQELLKKCKRDAVTAGRDSTKKSEIIRAALRHFASLSPSTQLMELNGLDPVKTGRPKKK